MSVDQHACYGSVVMVKYFELVILALQTMAGFKYKILEEVDKSRPLNLHLNEKFHGKFKFLGHCVKLQIKET